MRNLESQRERESMQRDLADPKQRAKVVRNWAKTLKDKKGREIDEPVRGELLLAGESGQQLTSEGQRLPSRRYWAANRLASPSFTRAIGASATDPYIGRACDHAPRFGGNASRMFLILRVMLRPCTAAPRPIHFFEISM